MPPKTITEKAPAGSLEELRNRISAAFRSLFPERQPDGTYRYAYVVATFADHFIASVEDKSGESYYRYPYTLTDAGVTFGDPTEVEIQYVPVEAIAEAARLRIERTSRPRQQFHEAREIVEAATAADGTTLTLTVIKAGFNVGRSRYYTEAAVREGAGIFRGLKMYIDHQTAAEAKAKPEGSLRDWAAVITETAYDATSKSLRATAKLIDPDFKAKIHALAEEGLLHTLGVSIRAVGSGEQALVEGVDTFRVDEFDAGISVDFVTEPGAGGQALLLEAVEEPGIHALTLPQLRERRPDLVAALLSESKQSKEAGVEITQEEYDAMKRRADEAEEAKNSLKAAEEARVAAESAVEAMKAEQAKAEAQEAIGKLIAESTLPEPSKKHLAEALKDEADVEAAKAAIESHKTLVASLTGKGDVRGNGGTGGGAGTSRPMAESLARLGFSEEQAAVAVRGR